MVACLFLRQDCTDFGREKGQDSAPIFSTQVGSSPPQALCGQKVLIRRRPADNARELLEFKPIDQLQTTEAFTGLGRRNANRPYSHMRLLFFRTIV